MAELNLCAEDEELCFTHGDTFVWERVIKDKTTKAVIDITGFGFSLAVDVLENPLDEATQIFVVTGVVPVGTDGRVQFQFSAAQWAAYSTAVGPPPNSAFYDLEQVDAAGDLRTIRKGVFTVKMDINKP